jgi:glutathione S-transferase
MTTHVICLDGTNQTKTQPCPTNIARLFDALGGTPTDGGDGSSETVLGNPPGVTGKYLPGVGALGRPALRALGNLFGDGIAEPIVRGYTYLSRSWRPGDEIILTGFSRGATAARALAGFVVSQGLLDPAKYKSSDKDQSYKRAIAAWYTYRSGRADLANQARLKFIGRLTGQIPRLRPGDFLPPPDVACVAVFDTVSSLGVPHLDLDGQTRFDFSICDTILSPKVKHGFHALAADEVREIFAPTFWAERNGIVQEIFAGGHSDVGGGYSQHGLSDCALDWMIQRLNTVRSIFDGRRLGGAFRPNSMSVAHDDSRIFPFTATPSRARTFPHIAVPSQSLRQRLASPVETLPGTDKPPYAPKGKYADGTSLL